MLDIRPLREDDLDVVRPWFLDPDTRRWLGGPDWPVSALRLARSPRGRHALLAVHDAVPVGLLDVEVYRDRRASFALVVDPAARRKGFASAMIEALDAPPGLESIDEFFGGVEIGNVASEGLVRAAGFVKVMEDDGFAYFARSRTTPRTPWTLPCEVPCDRQSRDPAI